jgi:hypothetical protein
MADDQPIQFACDPGSIERVIGNERQLLTGAVVDDRQDQETPASGELIENKVQLPTLASRQRHPHRRLGSDRSLATATTTHRQVFLALEAEELLVIHCMSFPHQQDMQVADTQTVVAPGQERPSDRA